MRRALGWPGVRFADYVVVDEEFATAPFLCAVGDLPHRVMARLKGNLWELYQAAQQRLFAQPAKSCFGEGQDLVEVWDADKLDPRGTHRVRAAIKLLRLLRLCLTPPAPLESS